MMIAGKTHITGLCILGLFCQISSAQDQAEIYVEAGKTEDLKAKEGQKVIVYGETEGSGKSGSGMNFVNFKGAEFYLVTFKSDLSGFKDGEPADIFDGKRIAVEGVISVYKNKPQIKLTSPDAVTELGEDEVFPPKTENQKPAEEKPTSATRKPIESGKTEAAEPKKKPPIDPKKYFK